MSKATIVEFHKFSDSHCIFNVTFGRYQRELHVTSFNNNGIATVDPAFQFTIDEFAEVIAGCFQEGSNFHNEILKYFGGGKSIDLISINFEFNGVNFVITKQNADAKKICKKYSTAIYGEEAS